MVNNSTNINIANNYLSPKESEVIVCYVDIGGIVDHCCLTFFRWEVIVCYVDIGGIVDHHCLTFFRWEVIVRYVDIGGINSNGQQFHQYQHNKQLPLT
jgi:hypothetical protein